MSVTQRPTVVTVGRATVVVRASHTKIVAISLNGAGKHRLAARGKLSLSIVVTQTVSGAKRPVSRQRLVL